MSSERDLKRLWTGTGAKEKPNQPQKPSPPPALKPVAQVNGYVAFETREGTATLHLHRATEPSRFPSYNYLLDIVYEHDFQSAFQLIYSFMAVEVRGEHLDPIIHALNYRNCERIHEYHPKLYTPPPPGQTIVREIKILAVADQKLKDEAVKK
jgi:hypothetical protein